MFDEQWYYKRNFENIHRVDYFIVHELPLRVRLFDDLSDAHPSYTVLLEITYGEGIEKPEVTNILKRYLNKLIEKERINEI